MRRRMIGGVAFPIVVLLLTIMGLPSITPRILAQCGGPIAAGQTMTGTITRTGDACSYTYTGAAAETVTITMLATGSSLDPYLQLIDPSRKVVAQDDDSGGGSNSRISYALKQAGTYTIIAGAYNSASTGGFSLKLDSSAAGICGGPIAANSWVSGNIARNGQRCQYTFSGTSGETVSIMMRATSRTLDPYLDLTDPRGTIVASDDDSYGGSNSLIKGYQLRLSGQYTIIARGYDSSSYGPFEVYLERKQR